ncbi:MAG: glycine zipper 2TM domain-containing protein [Gammaproteobacteria bacterium]
MKYLAMLVLSSAALVSSGCSTWDNLSSADKGTVGGAAVGGVVGNAVSGGGVLGTVGGAAVGGVVGREVGKDRGR